MRILIIEDDELVGPMLARVLRRRGHETLLVTTINSARQTLMYANVDGWHNPDCILSDKDLPDGNGWDYLDSFRTNEPKRVHMSGLPNPSVPYDYFHKGHDALERLYTLIEAE